MVGPVRSVFLFNEPVSATRAYSAIGAPGTTRNVLDQAGATSPTFGTGGVRGTGINFNNNSYLCSDANADGTCDNDADTSLGTVSFTVSLWFKHSITAAVDTLFEKCFDTTPAQTVGCVWGGMTASGAIAFGIDDDATFTVGSSYDDLITSTALYNDNQWHYAVFTNTDTDICLYIDGRQAVACDVLLAAAATVDTAAQILTVGGTCSGAACATGTNLWDGSIDDFVWSSNGGTTAAGLTAQSANKLYLDGRAHLIRPSTDVSDATTFTSTTIGDSSEVYVPGSFAGLVVELDGGTGAGQTRTIISNTATTFTVAPAFTVTPDATTDYRVNPSRLYGSTNNVTAISVDAPTNLNKIRKVYVGTSDGSDGGGISVFTNAGSGSVKTEVIHTDAGYAADDSGTTWSGTDADDITAINSYSDTLVLGTGAFFRTQRKDVSLKGLQTDTIGAIEDMRQQLVAMGLFGSTQDVLGLGQGADLAENYSSLEPLEQGTIVSMDGSLSNGIKKSTTAYQQDVIGIVATKPGMILGQQTETTYPVALVGRVPVRVTTENGIIKAGDRITSSGTAGYGMRATKAGRVLGTALEEMKVDDLSFCPNDPEGLTDKRCGQVVVFVNLIDYGGMSIAFLMEEAKAGLVFNDAGSVSTNSCLNTEGVATSTNADGLCDEGLTLLVDSGLLEGTSKISDRENNIIEYLKTIRPQTEGNIGLDSEIFTDRLSAAFEIFAPRFITEGLRVDYISALSESIIFKSDVNFFGTPYFTTDTAGFAVIKAGSTRVEVVFDREYIEKPIVNASMASSDGIASQEQSAAVMQAFFGKDIRFLISNASTTGFTIFINKPTDEDVTFNWIALAVKGAKLFASKEGQVPQQQPVINNTPTTTPPVINDAQPVVNNQPSIISETPTTTPSVIESVPTTTSSVIEPISTTTSPVVEEATTTPQTEPAPETVSSTETPTLTTEVSAETQVEPASETPAATPQPSVEPQVEPVSETSVPAESDPQP
jgi:hypothetical protein